METEELTRLVDGIYKNILDKFNPGARQLINAGKAYLKALHGAAAASRVYVEALSRLARQAQLGTWGGSQDVVFSNVSQPFVLPYRTRLFFDVDESYTFWFVFIYQSPIIYFHFFHAVSICILISLVLHTCGNLAVLTFRIKNLNVDSNAQHVRHPFRDIVEEQLKVKWMSKAINDTFCMVLLEEVIISTIILGLGAYNILVNSNTNDSTELIQCILFWTTIILTIFGYCVAGELLILESSNVFKAFYECEWCGLSSDFTKQLLICMAATNKPLYLSGGTFYIFSMAGFTDVLRTSMAYLSMLRAVP